MTSVINGPTLELVQGTSRDFRLQATKDKSLTAWTVSDPSPFLSGDTLASRVWAGRTRTVILQPTTTWVDAVTAKFQVTFGDADTASVAPGRYRIQTLVSRLGRSAVLLDGFIEISAIPGTGSAHLAFTSYSDILQYADWLQTLQTDQDEEAFLPQQVRATNRLIDMLVQQWRVDWWSGDVGGSMMMSGGSGSVTSPSHWLRQQLIPLTPSSVVPASMPDRVSPVGTIANYVDPTISTALMLHDEVKEIVAKLAIAYVCEQQIGSGIGGNTYHSLAMRYKREALSLYRSRNFEVDMGNPQTGYASFVIPGGLTSVR